MFTRPLIALSLAALAGACAQLPEPPIVSRAVDPTSPAAQRVLQAERVAAEGPYPTFQAIPPVPTDVRPLAAWNAATTELQGDRGRLEAWRAANPPELTDTEAWAATGRAQLGIDPKTLPPAPTPEETAAYVKSLQGRATPPPLPK